MQAFMPYLVVFAGLFSIVGAVADWDWFMLNRRAQLFVGLFGRNGARAFYVLLGLVIAGLGFAMVTGAIGPRR